MTDRCGVVLFPATPDLRPRKKTNEKRCGKNSSERDRSLPPLLPFLSTLSLSLPPLLPPLPLAPPPLAQPRLNEAPEERASYSGETVGGEVDEGG